MLMDNMAYLQQISSSSTSPAPSNGKKINLKIDFSKLLNVWTALIAGIFVLLILVVCVVAAVLGKTEDTGDKDLLLKSYFMAYDLNNDVFSENYLENVKNSDIRNMSASFSTVLNEIAKKDEEFLKEKYDIDIYSMSESDIATEEQTNVTKLADTLTTGKLNGVLDRTWLREMTMQVARIRAYQSGILARVDDEEIVEFVTRTEQNLDNIYNQFHDFKSVGI